MRLTVMVMALFFFSGCTSTTEKQVEEKEKYEKAVESLEEKVMKNPTQFLSVSGRDKHNLLGQTVIRGAISNRAKVCVYKDVELEVSFFSKTGTLLEKGNETIYDEILPGKSSEFKFKNFAPKGSDSITIKVLGAKTN